MRMERRTREEDEEESIIRGGALNGKKKGRVGSDQSPNTNFDFYWAYSQANLILLSLIKAH